MPHPNLFLLPAIPLLALYLPLFYRMIARLSEDERARFTKSGRRHWTFIVIAVPIALLLAPRIEVRLAAVLWLIPSAIFSARAHHRRLRDAGFSASFTSHLGRLKLLSFAATSLVVLSVALR